MNKIDKILSRKLARQFVLQGLYASLMNKLESKKDGIEIYLKEHSKFIFADYKLFDELFTGILRERNTLHKKFIPLSDRSSNMIAPIEYSILLIGSYELIYCHDIPYKVVINEAVELTKLFGGKLGFKFINKVLDRLANIERAGEKNG